jgi:hypothetical protein
MTPSALIWNDPRYSRFFRRATETIEQARLAADHAWLGEWEEEFHGFVLALCGVPVEDLELTGT